MKYQFETPVQVTVEFIPYLGGGCRKPLKIPYCVELITRKIITVAYIAKDGKEHRHKYNRHIIAQITCGGEVLYKTSEKRRHII